MTTTPETRVLPVDANMRAVGAAAFEAVLNSGTGSSEEDALYIYYAMLAAAPAAPAPEPVAYLVDGRIEQGLSFDKSAADVMAFANCGTVVPLIRADATPAPVAASAVELLRAVEEDRQSRLVVDRIVKGVLAKGTDGRITLKEDRP